MSTFEQQIDKIREYFDERKAERYPLENPALKMKDEYIKSLYFRIICALIRYTGEPNEMQILYVKRLIAGAEAEKEFPDYMKMALDLDTTDVDAFIDAMSGDVLRYYFCIDGAILLSVVNQEKNFALMAELVEMLGISEDELTYLAAVARAVCMQSSELFEEAQNFSTATTKELDLWHYLQEFYSGDIANTSALLHIISFKKESVDLSQYGILDAKRVIIENITDDVNHSLCFKGCAEVVIRNCELFGHENPLMFENIGTVVIEDCKIYDFTNRFAHFAWTNRIIFRRNKFRNCGCTSDRDICGGVLLGDDFGSVILEANELLNCYVARTVRQHNYWAKGIFFHSDGSGGSIEVNNNIFVGCDCKNTGNYAKAYISGYFNRKSESGNSCSGSVTQIFET